MDVVFAYFWMQIPDSSVPIATHERLGVLWNGARDILDEVVCKVLIHSPFAHICLGWEIYVAYPYSFAPLDLDPHSLGIFIAHIFYYLDAFSDEDGNSSPFSLGTTLFVDLISRYIKFHGRVL